jgi:hypothetical protein
MPVCVERCGPRERPTLQRSPRPFNHLRRVTERLLGQDSLDGPACSLEEPMRGDASVGRGRGLGVEFAVNEYRDSRPGARVVDDEVDSHSTRDELLANAEIGCAERVGGSAAGLSEWLFVGQCLDDAY